jgi:hypothetical protein
MATRNASRDAEQAQNEAGFGASSIHTDHKDEGGGHNITFR